MVKFKIEIDNSKITLDDTIEIIYVTPNNFIIRPIKNVNIQLHRSYKNN